MIGVKSISGIVLSGFVNVKLTKIGCNAKRGKVCDLTVSDFIEDCNIRARVEVTRILMTMDSLMMLRGFSLFFPPSLLGWRNQSAQQTSSRLSPGRGGMV